MSAFTTGRKSAGLPDEVDFALVMVAQVASSVVALRVTTDSRRVSSLLQACLCCGRSRLAPSGSARAEGYRQVPSEPNLPSIRQSRYGTVGGAPQGSEDSQATPLLPLSQA